ncbi:MAG: hypothetical protein KJO82_08300, partial [Gammaproteobacteria bacterium]|nr:hypothetical protein [Gammaproteobacteria bacterium]
MMIGVNKIKRFASVCTSMMLIFGVFATSQTLAEQVSHHPMRFEHLTLDQGLSQTNVLDVLQDSKGLMWFATENGLNSYDGYSFTHYLRERGNPDALGNDFIFDMAEDRHGNIWLATNGGGLAVLDRDAGKFRNFRHDPNNPNSVAGNTIRRLLIDEAGSIWIGTRGAGLDRFDPESQTFVHVSLGTASNASAGTIFTLYQDSNNTVWVGGDHGLSQLDTDGKLINNFTHAAGDESSISAHSVRTIIEDSRGQYWV